MIFSLKAPEKGSLCSLFVVSNFSSKAKQKIIPVFSHEIKLLPINDNSGKCKQIVPCLIEAGFNGFGRGLLCLDNLWH